MIKLHSQLNVKEKNLSKSDKCCQRIIKINNIKNFMYNTYYFYNTIHITFTKEIESKRFLCVLWKQENV